MEALSDLNQQIGFLSIALDDQLFSILLGKFLTIFDLRSGAIHTLQGPHVAHRPHFEHP